MKRIAKMIAAFAVGFAIPAASTAVHAVEIASRIVGNG
jgi:hypothetical protein